MFLLRSSSVEANARMLLYGRPTPGVPSAAIDAMTMATAKVPSAIGCFMSDLLLVAGVTSGAGGRAGHSWPVRPQR